MADARDESRDAVVSARRVAAIPRPSAGWWLLAVIVLAALRPQPQSVRSQHDSEPLGIAQAPTATPVWVCAEWFSDRPHRVQHPAHGPGQGDWLQTIEESGFQSGLLAHYGEACNLQDGSRPTPQQPVQDRIALIARGSCTFYDKLSNAMEAGAIGGLVYSSEDRLAVEMGCGAPSPCNDKIEIPGLHVDHQPGLQLLALLQAGTEVTISLGCAPPAGSIYLPFLLRRR